MKILSYISIICIFLSSSFCFSEETDIRKQQIRSNKLLILELQDNLSMLEKAIERQKELISENASIKKKVNNTDALTKRLDSEINLVKNEHKLTIENTLENKNAVDPKNWTSG